MRPNEVNLVVSEANPIDCSEALDQQRRAINVQKRTDARRRATLGISGHENRENPKQLRDTMGLTVVQHERVKYFLETVKPVKTVAELAQDLNASEDTALSTINDDKIQAALLKHLNNWFWTVEIKSVAAAILADVRKGDKEAIKLWIQIFGKPNETHNTKRGMLQGLPEDDSMGYIPEDSDNIDYSKLDDKQLKAVMDSGASADIQALKQVRSDLKTR